MLVLLFVEKRVVVYGVPLFTCNKLTVNETILLWKLPRRRIERQTEGCVVFEGVDSDE
jgi:hypothetical protein